MDITRGLQLLKWSRSELMEVTSAVPPERFEELLPGERWSIRGILAHIANTEFWYLSHLDLTSGRKEDLPTETMERLQFARSLLDAALPELADSTLVTGRQGEFWSPRKLLRRAVWHELDHTNHILKLLLV